MPDASTATLTKRASARRRRKNGDLDLERIVQGALSQSLTRDVYRDNKRYMQRIVGEFVRVRLEKVVLDARRDYPDETRVDRLIERMVFRKVQLVSSADIHVLHLQMVQMKQDTHFTTQKITEYIIRSFNKNRKQYGVVAVLHFADIVITADLEASREEIKDSMDELR